MMIKKILIILTSISLIPVLYWTIKCTYSIYYILVELPKVMEGSFYSKENYEMLVGSSGARATSFIALLFVLLNVLLILLQKGTFSELRKSFAEQSECLFYLTGSCVSLRIYPCELWDMRVFYISGIILVVSILLTVINIVGLIKTNKRAKNASCLKEDVV